MTEANDRLGRLVLERTVGQGIRIGDDILIRIYEKARGRFKVVIEAPREIPVLREELHERATLR